MALYAIKTPKGKLIEDTAFPDSSDVWDNFFDNTKTGRKLSYKFIEKDFYCELEDEARSLGYERVRVYVTEERPK